MRIFTNDAALVASGSQYLRAVALSYVLCGISQVYLILLKNTGHAAVSSRISSTAVVLNIILNAILIYGLLRCSGTRDPRSSVCNGSCPRSWN